jgi:CheY-like chemotaxis protein
MALASIGRRLPPETQLLLRFRMTRVLLVEDSGDVLEILRIELEWLGYSIDAARDATTALSVAERTPPDVIVSDLGMPGIDGFEFIRRVRANSNLAHIPAIALTGASLEKHVQQALAFGFTAHLLKPVEPQELSSRIEQLTARQLSRKAS